MSDAEIIRRLVKDMEMLKAEQKRLASLTPLFWVGNHDPASRSLSSNQNNYDPGNYDSIQITPTTPLQISGISGGVAGRRLLIYINADFVNFSHQDASSNATNRIITITAATVTKSGRQSLLLLYSPIDARWLQVF